MHQNRQGKKGEIYNWKRIGGEFNITFSIVDRTTRQKISKATDDLNNTMNQPYLINTLANNKRTRFFSKCHWKLFQDRSPEWPKQPWKKNNLTGELPCPKFRTYYQATEMKTMWYQHKDKPVDWWSRMRVCKQMPVSVVGWFSTSMPRSLAGKIHPVVLGPQDSHLPKADP